MIPEKHVWVFIGNRGKPSAVFTRVESAEAWVKNHRLSGTLSALPVDEGCFDWAVRLDCTNLKPEKRAAKFADPEFIGNFLTASLEHFHYEDGARRA